jgi:hypothetical protein
MPLDSITIDWPSFGCTTPNDATVLRARGSDGPLKPLVVMKCVLQRPIAFASASAVVCPATPVSQPPLSSTLPLQSSSMLLPAISAMLGFTSGLLSSQSPWPTVTPS